MSQLVIRLPYPDSSHSASFAYVLSADGHTPDRSGHAEAALLPFHAAQDIVALVPVQALSWHQVTLPQGSLSPAHKLRSVLEGLLEEHLLEDPADLHFALAPHASTGTPIWIATCHANWLRTCLDVLEQAGYTVGRIVPEFHPQPAAAPPRLYAIDSAQPDAALWVLCGAAGTDSSAHGAVLHWPLPLTDDALAAPSSWPGLADMPEPAAIQADPAVARTAEQLLRQPVQVVAAPQRWLHTAQSDWNLAQLAFANTGRDRLRKRSRQLWHHFSHAPHWRAVRWGVIGLLAIQLIGLNVWAWRTRQHMAQQQQEITQILQSTFPQVRVVVDAPTQMQRQVDLLQQGSGVLAATDLEALLATITRHTPDAQLRALEWNPPELRLKGLVLSDDAQAALQADLRQIHMQLQQDGTDWLLRPMRDNAPAAPANL